MSRRGNDAFADAATGVFMLAVLALLAYFTIVISGVDLLRGTERVTVEVAFDGVGGLKDHDNVMYRGTKVGTVSEVRLTPTNLVARIDIDNSVVLRKGCRVYVQSMSLLGGNHLVLEEGEGEQIELGGAMLRGETPSDWMRDIAQVAKNLSDITGGGGLDTIVTNIAVMSEKVRLLSERIERGEGTLGRLMSSDDTLYRNLDETIANARVASVDLKSVVSNANIVAERLATGQGPMGRLFSPDETVLDDLKGAIAAFRKSCESFDLGDLKDDARGVVEGAGRLVDTLNVVAGRIRDGEGTLGRLSADDTLYKEVEALVRDVRQVIDNYRDTTPITTFSSLATGAL